MLDELLEEKGLLNHPVHISFDIDPIGPSDCSNTNTSVTSAMSMDDVINICTRVKETSNVVSVDLVEFNPLVGTDEDVETTIQSIRKVMNSIL